MYIVHSTSRVLSIVGKRERGSCILNDMHVHGQEDLMKVATLARATKVQCWITSCNVQLFRLASCRQRPCLRRNYLPSYKVTVPSLALAVCNDTVNGSYALSVDEVRDRGSPNRESQHTSQGLLVTRRDVQLTSFSQM